MKLPKIVKKPKITAKPKTGKIEGQYWVWQNGLKTHLRFMLEHMKRKGAVPQGFLKACEKSTDPNLRRLAQIAELHGIKTQSA